MHTSNSYYFGFSRYAGLWSWWTYEGYVKGGEK